MRPISPLGPGGRPFAGWRPLAALMAAVAMSANAALLLSDRTPERLERWSSGLDASSRASAQFIAQVLSRSDFAVHLSLWAAVSTLAGLAMWSRRSLRLAAAGVLIASLVAEAAQEVLTQTRQLEGADIAANVIGVVLGLVTVSGVASLAGWEDKQGGGAIHEDAVMVSP